MRVKDVVLREGLIELALTQNAARLEEAALRPLWVSRLRHYGAPLNEQQKAIRRRMDICTGWENTQIPKKSQDAVVFYIYSGIMTAAFPHCYKLIAQGASE